MAHKKGGGSSRNNRDSNAQRLGVKRFGGEFVTFEWARGSKKQISVHPEKAN